MARILVNQSVEEHGFHQSPRRVPRLATCVQPDISEARLRRCKVLIPRRWPFAPWVLFDLNCSDDVAGQTDDEPGRLLVSARFCVGRATLVRFSALSTRNPLGKADLELVLEVGGQRSNVQRSGWQLVALSGEAGSSAAAVHVKLPAISAKGNSKGG